MPAPPDSPPAGDQLGAGLSVTDALRLLDDPQAAAVWGRGAGLVDPESAHRSRGGRAYNRWLIKRLAGPETRLPF